MNMSTARSLGAILAVLFLCALACRQPSQQAHDPAIFKTLNKRFAVLNVEILGRKKLFKLCDLMSLLAKLRMLVFELLGLLHYQRSQIGCKRIRGGTCERTIDIAHWCAKRR